MHRLDEVGSDDWRRFWTLNEMLIDTYDVHSVEDASGVCRPVRAAREVRGTWHADDGTDSPLVLYVPELECVYEEHHDYSNLLWHRSGVPPQPFLALVEQAGLHNFDRK